jgi:rod shape-determining protein MreD
MFILSSNLRQIINGIIIVVSVLICILLLPARLPGMELLGINPHWLLIWVVAWSVKRTSFEGAIAGLILGLILDGMTGGSPTHIFGLMLVGIITARLQKEKYIKEDFISISLIVFGMVILTETITAIQYMFQGLRNFGDIWLHQQKVALASAILSSLWAPVLYYPLNLWWARLDKFKKGSFRYD